MHLPRKLETAPGSQFLETLVVFSLLTHREQILRVPWRERGAKGGGAISYTLILIFG